MSCFCFEVPPGRQWTLNSKIRTPAAELSRLLLSSIQFGCGSDIFDTCSLFACRVKWHITVGSPSQNEADRSMERNHWAENLGTRHLEHIVTCLWYNTLQLVGSTASLQILSLRQVSLPLIGLFGYWWQVQEKRQTSCCFLRIRNTCSFSPS